jgi:hypothetical protein
MLIVSIPLHPDSSHEYVRLIIRISFKVGAEYVPMSFMLDTAAPNEFYFSEKAYYTLKNVLIDYRNGSTLQIPVNFGCCAREPELFPVSFTPKSKQLGNFIGVNGLMQLGLKLNEPPDSFSLGCNISWF